MPTHATTPQGEPEPRLSVRVPQEVHDVLRRNAQADDRTVSSYVRQHLLDTLPNATWPRRAGATR